MTLSALPSPRSKLPNAGKGAATGIQVKVRFLAEGDVLVELDAQVPDSCDPGKTQRFEAACSGAGIPRITDLEATVTWAEEGD